MGHGLSVVILKPMSDMRNETPPLDEPPETNVQEGDDLDEAVIIRWVLIVTVASFVIGVIFMAINAHYSPY